MKEGTVVLLPDGRRGTVTGVFRAPGCGCATVFVRLARGEWAGTAKELRVVRS